MDIEQLKLIIEMLNGLGAGTKDIVMLYLGAEYVLKPMFVIAGIMAAGWGVARAMGLAMSWSDDNQKLQEIRDRLGVGSHGYFCRSEFKKVIDKLEELRRNAK